MGQIPQAFVAIHPTQESAQKEAVRPYAETFGIGARGGFEFDLGPVNLAAVLAADEALAAAGDKTLRIGLQRGAGADLRHARWVELEGGRLWILDVVSPGAIGVRLHFAGAELPVGAGLVVYSPINDSQAHGPYEGAGPLGTGDFWTPTLAGPRARIEYFLPHDIEAPFGEPFMIDALMHLYRDPLAAAPEREGSCHNDVMCEAGWIDTAKAVAGIATTGSFSLFCTGQMLNSQNADFTPYFLTARHCVATSAEANGAEIYWLFQKSSCGAAAPSIFSVPRSATCTMLTSGSSSDFALLMVEGTVPRTQIAWAGWNAGSVTNGTAAACIHHPDGAFKRISFGSKATAAASCGGSNHVRVSWSSGATEPGSSGGGAFRTDTQQLFGQLHCGPSSCASITHDDYGAFSNSYLSLSGYLSGGSDDTREDNDFCASAYSLGVGGYSNLIVKSADEDWYSFNIDAGQSVTISLSFLHAYGDIDCTLHSLCNGPAIASSLGTSNSEVINFTNTGDASTFFLRVYLAADTRNTYNMTIAMSCSTPEAPSGIAASDGASCTAVNISWNPIAGADGYEVWRGTTSSTSSAGLVGTPVASPFSDATASPGTAYFYFVKSENGCGASPFSDSDSGWRATAPSAPTGVGASDSTSCSAVVVAWTGSAGASGFQAWRAPSNSLATASLIASPASSPYSDMTVPAGITHFYWVLATGMCGTSGFSGSDGGTRAKLVGDADNNGAVNFADVTSVLSNWGQSYLPSPGTGPGDADANGAVNFTDISYILANWGSICP